MLSTLFTVALFVAASIHGVLADFAVNTPQLEQCKPARISWEPTQGPYSVLAVKASDPCGDPIVDIGNFDATITQWTATIPAGTEVILVVLDANDLEAWSSKIVVGASGDSSCLPTIPPTSSSTAPSTGNTDVSPVGAVNAGLLASSALTARQASMPLLAIAGLVSVFVLL